MKRLLREGKKKVECAMSRDEIMQICKHCGHQIICINKHWGHLKSSKQQIGENSKFPEPDIHSNCCVECEDIGKRCCNPEPKEEEKKG